MVSSEGRRRVNIPIRTKVIVLQRVCCSDLDMRSSGFPLYDEASRIGIIDCSGAFNKELNDFAHALCGAWFSGKGRRLGDRGGRTFVEHLVCLKSFQIFVWW